MHWIIPLGLAALLGAATLPQTAAAAPAASPSANAPNNAAPSSAKPPSRARQQARPATATRVTSRAQPRPVPPRAAAQRPVLQRAALIAPLTPHPGLGGLGLEAEAFCGTMQMPAGELRQVARGISRGHAGLDLMAPHGTPVLAAAAGSIIYAGRYFAYGNMVDISHADGVVTRYAHLSAFAENIVPGMSVTAGQEIGSVGATGRASGPHVHFEVRVAGRPLDPKPFLSLAACDGNVGREEVLEAADPPPRPVARARRAAARQVAR